MVRPAPRITGPFLRRIRLAEEGLDRTRHPFDIAAFAGGIDLELRSNVTFLVGENGSGKSTLLEAVAKCCGFPEQGGGRDHQLARPVRDPDLDSDDPPPPDLASALRLSWLPKVADGFFMRAESFFNFATYIDGVSSLGRYGGTPLHAQSHGESFLALFANRFQRGIYLLDEPEAALSPQRQLSFLKILHDLETTGRAQFLIASHSPILLAYPGATLYSLDGDGVVPIAYAETAHYRLMKHFLESPERYFRHLFGSGEM